MNNKFFKVLIISSLVILTGCGSNNKKAAIESFAANVNYLNKKKAVSMESTGQIDVPSSMFGNEAIEGDIEMEVKVDTDKNMYGYLSANIPGLAENEIEMYADDKYSYIKENGLIKKSLLEDESYDMFYDYANGSMKKSDIEKMLASFSKVKYSKTKIDGVEGYEIIAKTNLYDLLKQYKEELEATSPEIDLAEMKTYLKVTKLEFKVFTPFEVTGEMKYTFNISFNYFGVKGSLKDFEINLSPLDKKIVIPKEYINDSQENGLDYDVEDATN